MARYTGTITELVNPLCRNGVDAKYLSKKLYNLTTTMPKAYLSAQPSSLSALSKIQLNMKVCGSESAIFVILIPSLFRPLCQTTVTQK